MKVVFSSTIIASAAMLLSGCQQSAHKSTATTPVAPAAAMAENKTPVVVDAPVYVFGWGERPKALATPRGGSSRGAPVTLAPARALPLPEIAAATSAYAKDRAAILALAGDYRVSFHFMESLELTAESTPKPPYHSWATEQVRVLEDRSDFISLQHTLVMFFTQPDGTVSKPMLTKHWRQDWTYEDSNLHTFRGNNTWARRQPSAEETKGAWSQAVFQVDDSPRYEALGRWEHRGNASVWTSEREWRPLPRREFTVRKDYDVMEGVHRIVITPTGWVHDQKNWKRVAGDSSNDAPRFVAEEWGLDRYERISAPSLAAADDYWQKTGPYWSVVRKIWREELASHDRFTLRSSVNNKKLFELHFADADKWESGEASDLAEAEKKVRADLESFLAP